VIFWFRPLWFVIAYFLGVSAYGLFQNAASIGAWATLDQWHDVLGILAGFSFAFKNRPADKAAMVALLVYVLGLAAFDRIIPSGYGMAISLAAGFFCAWVFWIRRAASRGSGEERTR